MATACIGTSNGSIGNLVYALQSVHTMIQDSAPVIMEITDNNLIVALLFGQQQSIGWEEFKSLTTFHLKAKEEDVENLKSILVSQLGSLERAHFAKFLRWFTPLVPESDNTYSRSPVWKISSIAKLIQQPWFHGFTLNSKKLKQSAEGTFCIRFSCQAPHFILALKEKSTDTVMEWRVLASCSGVHLQDGDRFADLHQLIDNYMVHAPCGASCALAHACV